MINNPVKFPIRNSISDWWSVQTDIKGEHLVYPWSYKGSRQQQHKGIFPINTSVIVCLWYFNNNMISVITVLALDKVNISSIQIYTFCSPYFFLGWSLKKILISKLLLKIKCLLKGMKFTGSPNAYLQK